MKVSEHSSFAILHVNSKVDHWPSKMRVLKTWAMDTWRWSAICHMNRVLKCA